MMLKNCGNSIKRKMRAAMYTESGVWIDFEAFDNRSAIKTLMENAKNCRKYPGRIIKVLEF